MNRQNTFFVLVIAALLCGLVYVYTKISALAFILFLIASCATTWSVVWVYFEYIRNKDKNVPKSVWIDRSRLFYSAFSVLLLTVIFLSSVYTLGLYVLPKESKPYFLNTDYHYIYNSGVSFTSRLTIYTPSENYKTQGLFQSESGTLVATKTDSNRIRLSGDHLLVPIFCHVANSKKDDSVYTPINIPFDANIATGFTLANDKISLRLSIIEVDSGNILRPRPRTLIQGDFYSNDKERLRTFGIGAPYTSHFSFYLKKHLKVGYSLEDLLMSTESWNSDFGETRQVLSDWLTGLKNCYLLVRHETKNSANAAKDIVFFPSQEFIEDKYILKTNDGQTIHYNSKMDFTVFENVPLYGGFANKTGLFSFVSDSTEAMNMNFIRPQYLPLHARGPAIAAPGTQYIRSLYNHYTGFINSAVEEGCLFHENLRNAKGNTINGYIVATVSRPGQAFQYSVFDANGPVRQQGLFFSLSSDIQDVRWQFGIRDFSQGNIQYNTIFWILSLLYLLTATLLIFFPEPTLSRIEPCIYYVLYGFVFTRCIMLWRIATFPPAESGTYSEISNYTNYEYIWGIPFTVICIVIFFTAVVIYRIRELNRRLSDLDGSPRQLPRWKERLWGSTKGLVFLHLLILVFCGILGKVIAPRMSTDYVSRFASILLPVCSYFVIVSRLRVLTTSWSKFNSNGKPWWISRVIEFFKYGYDSNETLLSLMTLGLMMSMDRGFGVLFLLFLLFKTIAVSFARRPFTNYDNSIFPLLSRGQNYWIYGLLSLVIYIIFLTRRDLFHNILLQLRWIIVAVFIGAAFTSWVVLEKLPKVRRRAIAAAIFALSFLFIIPQSWERINDSIKYEIKHVKHRASLIYLPVNSIISRSVYNSSEEKKILETAESQWFINSYLRKPYDSHQRINFRSFFDQGVNYITQTRDVVLPRFVIAELGNDVVFMLLLLLALPLTSWFIFYRLYDRDIDKGILKYPLLTHKGYSSMMALILLFTLGLFVWLTSTNRFVFFGQDFPFLALSSRMSIMFPLVLLFFVLCGRPRASVFDSTHFRTKGLVFTTFFAIICICIWITGRSPQLDERNFNVKMNETDSLIDNPVNDLLSKIQDTMQAKEGNRPNIYKAIQSLKKTSEYQSMLASSSQYTNSILQLLTNRPYIAFQPQSPVFLRYDQDENKYSVVYNRNLFLELPAYEEGRQWTGNIYESTGNDICDAGTVTFNNTLFSPTSLPNFASSGGIKVALLPSSWVLDHKTTLALISICNQVDGTSTVLHMCDARQGGVFTQDVCSFALELRPGILGYALQQGIPSVVRYETASGKAFAHNYYINGRQRMIYPLAENCFWVSQYAHAINTYYASDSFIHQNAPITLNYALTDTISRLINEAYSKRLRRKISPGFRFAVIAADGDGNVRLMADYAQSRELLDPNNRRAVHEKELENFFQREAIKEREQWGNMNLIHMGKGPGSSIKPIIAAAVASEVNAGWEDMKLLDASPIAVSKKGHPCLEQYAGMDITSCPWEASEGAEFAACDFRAYIANSINLYHSIFLFLGSYSKASFKTLEGQYSLRALLTPNNDNGNNTIPKLGFREEQLYLPSYTKRSWPLSGNNDGIRTYFGNQNSILALGLGANFALDIKDRIKNDRSYYASAPVNIGDTAVYDTLLHRASSGFRWSYPESSDFMQANRIAIDPMTNFKDGLQHPARGGRPYNMTPFMMAQMFGALATYNAGYTLRLSPSMPTSYRNLYQDESWNNHYRDFLKAHLLKAMEEVLSKGTAKRLFRNTSTYQCPDGRSLYCYAKTGTIGSESGNAGQSRRLALIISNEDLTSDSAETAKIYTVFFTSDKTGDHNWVLYNKILDALINSNCFINYMQQ